MTRTGRKDTAFNSSSVVEIPVDIMNVTFNTVAEPYYAMLTLVETVVVRRTGSASKYVVKGELSINAAARTAESTGSESPTSGRP